MFCDLVGSTALSERVDPEELRDILIAYQDVCGKVIARFGGFIARYLGDGLLVYFGFPLAHEDDAQRAVRAALDILDDLARLDARLWSEKEIRLSARLAVHTGLVVVGEIGASEQRESMAIVGETPNVAARLQEVAEPNTVVISAATHRLVHGYFSYRALGPRSLKGLSVPVEVYHVLGESGVQHRLDAAVTAGLTPLVGREQEWGLLLRRWEQASDGRGNVVLLDGEAGIGKSRLVATLKEHVAGVHHTRWECRCSPYHQESALYPMIDLFQRSVQFDRTDSPEARLCKIEAALKRYNLAAPETVAIWASLLSVPLPDEYPPPDLSPQRQKQKTLEAVLTLLVTLSTREPLLLIVEDLHWVDPSTLELLDLIVDQAATIPVLVVLTFRPDFTPPWSGRAHLSRLTLSRLSHSQTELMVQTVVGGTSLPPSVLQQITARTDGVPLFDKELTKMVLETGLLDEQDDPTTLPGPVPSLAIPTTLQDSLMARLDRLAAVKEVAQLGATLGRAFPYELLRAVSPLDEPRLQRELGLLVEAELLYQRGVPPNATYFFKHALIQEAAYQSLLRATRQRYHRRIARVLAEHFPEKAETQPELLAHHFAEAGLRPEEVVYWQRAGQRAIERSALAEAIVHLRRGLDALRASPETPDRARQELELQTTIGPALMSMRGYAAPEVQQTYARARELCQQIGETPQLFRVLWGLWMSNFVSGQLPTARELGEELLALAQNAQDSAPLVEAHRALGTVLFFQGELAAGRAHLEQALEHYDPELHRSHVFRYGQDPAVTCLAYAAWALWALGYPDLALKRSREALALAETLDHPFTLVFAKSWASRLHAFRRERQQEVRALVREELALAREHGYTLRQATSTITLGWAEAEDGQGDTAIEQMCAGLTAFAATGTRIGYPHCAALLIDTYLLRGRVAEGLSLVAEVLAAARVSGERHYEAELHRLHGELLLRQCDAADQPSTETRGRSEAEACFERALDLARQQGAKTLELRATVSLSRLWRHQGKCDEARQTLAVILDWFTEGAETADLVEATAVLADLRSQ